MTALTAALTLDIPVGVAEQPTRVGGKPWVVIWPDAGRTFPATMKANDGRDETWVCQCFGLSPDSAGVAASKLTTAVYALARQTIAGRIVQYPQQVDAAPLTRDDQADPPLWMHAVTWRFRTTPV